MKKFLKVCIWLIILLAAAGIILRLLLPGIIVSKVNEALAKQLNAKAELGDIDLNITGGYVALKNLTIGQPEGFGDGNFLHAGTASVTVNMTSLNTPLLQVSDITLDDVQVHIVKKKDGTNAVMNVTQLMSPPDPAAPAPATEPAAEEAKEGQDIQILSAAIRNTTVRYTDETLEKKGQPLDITVSNITLQVTDLFVLAAADDSKTGTLDFSANIAQPTGQAAPIGLAAKIGRIDPAGTPPSILASLQLVGLELKTIKPALVPGVAEAIGGNALDLTVDVSLHDSVLDCEVLATTDKGNAYPASAKGPLDNLKYSASGILASQLKRPGKFLMGITDNFSESAEKLVGSTVDAGKDLAEGAAKTVGKVGKGLFNSVKNLAKGDIKGAVGGLEEATVGAASEAVDTVQKTTGDITGGVNEVATTAVLNDEKPQQWRKDVLTRYQTRMDRADENLKSSSWPPEAAISSTSSDDSKKDEE